MDSPTHRGLSQSRLWIFDLGDTLYEYVGVPLNWERHYPEALDSLARHWGLQPTAAQRQQAAERLLSFNTRRHPRLKEVSFAEVGTALGAILGNAEAPSDLAAARAFFDVFRQRLAPFPDAAATLDRLHEHGFRVAAFTDVPYGMPRELVEDDLRATGLLARIDLLVTSVEVGWRKPSPEGLLRILAFEGVQTGTAVYVGNERKDIEAAKNAGIRAVLVDRDGLDPAWGQDARCPTLTELP